MEENRLIKYEKNQLQRIANAVTITNKLLVASERKRIIELFCNHPDFFIKRISENYPLNNHLIEKYRDVWNWREIGFNVKINRNEELIVKYRNKWDWETLGSREDIIWSLPLIGEFKSNRELFKGLSKNKNVPWSDELINLYRDNWNWQELGENEGIKWTESNVTDNFQEDNLWRGISRNRNFKCSVDFINKHYNSLDWEYFSANSNIIWTESLINAYSNENRFWNGLSRNKGITWSTNFIDKYISNWTWPSLGYNIKWTDDLIEKYQGIPSLWTTLEGGGSGISSNECMIWSELLIDKYADKLSWHSLSYNESLPWSKSFYEKYFQKWVWWGLCMNKKIEWTESFIEKNIQKINWWNFSINDGLPWSSLFIKKYEKKWKWNSFFGFSHMKNFWIKGFLPYLDDTLIEEVLVKIGK